MAIIRITDLALHAIIGTNAWERTTRQKVIINVAFEYNSSRAVKNDGIAQAVDYKAITKKIIAGVRTSQFYLLEKLADYILNVVFEDSRIKCATVRVDKPKALRFAKSVSAEVSAYR